MSPKHISKVQLAIERGDTNGGLRLLSETLQLSERVGDKAAIARGLELFAALEIQAGQCDRGLLLAGSAATVRLEAGMPISPREHAWLETYLLRAQDVVGSTRARQALANGRDLSWHRAIVLAREEHRRAAGPRAEILSPRETEVSNLVAQGLTNPQIAAQLVVGERTVQTHVANVLSKLGFSSRAQIAAWVTEQRLRQADP